MIPVDNLVLGGYGLFVMTILLGAAMLMSDGIGVFMEVPASAQAMRRRRYFTSLARAVLVLVAATLLLLAAGITLSTVGPRLV